MTDLAAYRTPPGRARPEPARLAALLGMPDAERVDELTLARRVGDGLGVAAAEALGALVAPLGRGAIHAIVSEPTLRRARAGRALSREPSERLYQMGRVLDRAARAFGGDETMVRRFLARPHPLLEGGTPFEVARSSAAGADALIRILEEAEAGVAV